MEQFARWMGDAAEVLPEPTAMVLATVSARGLPRARTVLLKGHSQQGFTFYTNMTSRKGQDLAANPRACVVFPWFGMQRQVTAEGPVTMMTQEQSEPYYRSRPRGSQLGAWASRQSTVLDSREQLDERAAEMERRWPDGSVIPMPDFWRGYLLAPETVEFWQAGRYRLHDRLRYRRARGGTAAQAHGGGTAAQVHSGAEWVIERLSP